MNRIRKATFFGIAFLVLSSLGFVAFGLWYNASAESRFQSRVAERQKAGLPSQLTDLNGASVPDEENVAAQLVKISGTIKDLHSRLDEHLPKESIPNRYLTESEIAKLEPILNGQLSTLNELITIAKLPSFHSPLPKDVRFADIVENSISSDLTNLSLAGDLLRTRALHAHSANQLDESLQALFAALSLASLAIQAPTADGYILYTRETTQNLKTLNLVLQQSTLSDSQYAELKRSLEKIETLSALRKALVADSATYATGLLEQEGALSWFNRGRVYSALNHHYDMFDEFIQDADIPLDQWEEKYADFDMPFSWNPFINLVNLNRANCLAYRTMSVRLDILKRCTLVLAKIQQKVASNSMDITIDKLNLSAEEIQDPYSDQPLILKGSPTTGWVIYSVSANRRDDGGDFENSMDHGIGPSQEGE